MHAEGFCRVDQLAGWLQPDAESLTPELIDEMISSQRTYSKTKKERYIEW